MNIAARILGVSVIAIAASSLSGCWWSAEAGCSIGSCHPSVIIKGGSGSGPGPLDVVMGKMVAATGSFDPSAIQIDTTGTDYDVGNSGSATITLLDSNGATVASSNFVWVRSGATLVFQSPASVSSWAANYPTAASASAQVDAGVLPADGVSHTLQTATYYQGTKEASAASTYAAQCSDPRTHHVYICAQ